MELIVDLHIHSKYARATSNKLDLESIYKWSKIKGINVIGTGNFTHPKWFEELNQKLEPAEDGLYKLKDTYAKDIDETLPENVRNTIQRFILATEISNIYTKNGKGRRLHNLVIVPSLEVASQINTTLGNLGNLKSDGRPIIGMDSKDLLKITLDSHPDALFIPAHIWTPWFAMFGSKSGFDSIEETFEELAPEIKAIETGLSSDPFMNWRVPELATRTIVSGSDAHSLPKLAREATVLNCNLSYAQLIGAIRTNDHRFVGTIEFFPQEGMYHHDGHRKCNFSCSPSETKKYNGLCPKCGKPLVVGVQYRVDELAQRPPDYFPTNHKSVEYVIPLVEIIAEIKGVKGINSKTVLSEYQKVYSKLGTEFDILRKIPVSVIQNAGFVQLAHAIKKLRTKDIYIEPGYDGVYGIVQIFAPNELQDVSGQLALF